MRDQPHFRNGQTILLREIWNNQVWSARPEIVVQDKPELMAFYMPGGTMWKQPRTVNDSRVNAQSRSQSEWVLKVAEWLGSGRLRMTIPGKHSSVLIFWNAEDGTSIWKTNYVGPH